MIYFIYGIDPTTNFLQNIIDTLEINNIRVDVIRCNSNQDSYNETIDRIKLIPDGATVIFLGHGKSDQLYGGQDSNLERRSLINIKGMSILRGKKLLAIACDSANLIKSSMKLSGLVKAIGFKELPTEMNEVVDNKRLVDQGISIEDINDYKNIIVTTIAKSLVCYSRDGGNNFYLLYDYIELLINKEINTSVIKKRNARLAKLLYQMKADMVLF